MRARSKSPIHLRAANGAGRLLVCLALCAAVGCGQNHPPPPQADPAKAREALQAALNAWQQGIRPETLLNGTPPMIVSDYEWRDGAKLLSYQLMGDGELDGVNLRCPVLLVLEGTPGQPVQREAAYFVGTEPKISVMRRDPSD
jgi:hypothetical protein